MTYNYIRKMVEKKANIKDLSAPFGIRETAHARFAFFKLCQKYLPKWSYSAMGLEVNRIHHTSALGGIRRFNKMYGTNQFLMNDLYKICDRLLKEEYLDSLKAEKMNIEYETVRYGSKRNFKIKTNLFCRRS